MSSTIIMIRSNTKESKKGWMTRTASQSHSLNIVIRNIVLDPRPVRVSVADRIRMGVEHLCDGAVAEEAWREGHLESEPVFALADVEDVAGVCGTGCVLQKS